MIRYYTVMGCVLLGFGCVGAVDAEDRPYLTTQTPLTLFSTNDGEYMSRRRFTNTNKCPETGSCCRIDSVNVINPRKLSSSCR